VNGEAYGAIVVEVLKDGRRVIEWPNGRRSKIKFERCHICKEDRPYMMFQGAVCLYCKGYKLKPVQGFKVVRPGKRTLEYSSQRYARLKQATPPWVDTKAIRKIHSEAKRLTRETGISHHVDHIWPLLHESFCGLNVPWNLRVIPGQQNMLKHTTPPLEFLQQITYG